jgi:SAM-dependent methyltransferase
MVTGGVVDYDAARGRYALPGEHAASLCREGALGNLAASCQWLPVLGCVEDSVVECFERGGGVPPTAFGRVRAVVLEESDRTLVSGLLERVLPLVPGLAERLAAGIDVLDLGCGSGRAPNRLARAFPASRFAGYDLSPEAIGAARAEARGLGLENVRFAVRDAAALGHAADFDLITAFDAIHDQARPEAALAAVARALRPAGVFLMQEVGGTGRLERDVGHPLAPFLYALSCMHCVTVSLASGGAGLGAMWGADAARQMLARAGFAAIEEHALPHDARHRYFVARRAPDG